ncbi:response regulator [Rhizobium subbaraonis]|uniref:response regulator n=1 Tax=Rhizobium subbaraonis TaxID=908946 RepID=UPI000BE24B6F
METPHIVSVIDDEEAVRRATSSLLRSLGFSVRAFVSAEDFLGSECVSTCACIVSDVQMDGMSGIDLFTMLRERQSTTPFVFITASSGKAVRAQVGPEVCVLQKPFQAEALATCVENAIASK